MQAIEPCGTSRIAPRGDDRGLFGSRVLLTKMAAGADGETGAQGRWIGMLKVSRQGLVKLKATLDRLRKRPDFDALDIPALLNELIAAEAAVEVLYLHGHWRGVNDLEDFQRAVDFAHAGAKPPGSPHD